MMIKLLKEFPGYAISSTGQVYSKKSGKWLKYKTSPNKQGYGRLSLRKNSKYCHKFAHRLVAEMFLDTWDPALQVNHIDGNKLNNNASNLEMCTARENVRHALSTGLGVTGEKSIHAKLTYKEVIEIRKRLASGEKGYRLAIEFGGSKAMISCIKSGKNWKYELNINCGE